MRLSGLASGLDVDSMVKELMKARRTSLDKIVQQRMTLEWQREQYREMSTKLVDFRNNKLAGYSLSSAIAAKKSEVSGNTAAISINSTASTAAGSYTVTDAKLATTANTILEYSGTYNSSSTLKDLGFSFTNGNGSVSINNVAVSISENDTLDDLVTKINANKNTKVTALYDSASGKISLTSNVTGKINGDGKIDIAGFDDYSVDPSNETAGDNASVAVNGITYTQSSNTFTVGGINFTLKAELTTGQSSTINVTTDSGKILETIKSFVTDYNSLITSINGELNEERYRKYAPLTDEQKEAMTESQIKMWEDKAKSGLIRSDSILSQLVSDMRISSVAEVQVSASKTININSIGITTGSWTERGKLVIEDEAKLLKAIEEDPDAVIALFTNSGSSATPESDDSGVFKKMTKSLMTALEQLSSKAGTSLTSTNLNGTFMANSVIGVQIRDLETKESNLERRLSDIENGYYKQFAAMESAINKYNSQASSLNSYFS